MERSPAGDTERPTGRGTSEQLSLWGIVWSAHGACDAAWGLVRGNRGAGEGDVLSRVGLEAGSLTIVSSY